MKLLHTSDWHLGRSLYDKKRYDEFELFLDWLIDFIAHEKIELLLISGDVFDTTTPSNRAQELYYQFLSHAASTGCRHMVIIGGNHDSPTFLEAPKTLLGKMNIHVVGAIPVNTENEVFRIKDDEGITRAIVCAMPYLRDRDIRTVEAGESIDDKTRKLLHGIALHYREVAEIASNLQDKDNPVPVIGMGHLFTTDAKTTDGDGIRELYVGSIAHVDGSSISSGFDYMALGHLHLAQTAGGSDVVRYSGSPLQMSFAEAGHIKKVVVADFYNGTPLITEHVVPCFRKLEALRGDFDAISERIGELKRENSKAWLEIEITSSSHATNITSHLNELLAGSGMEILRVKNRNVIERALTPLNENENLDELDDEEVFKRCLTANEITGIPERDTLIDTYREARLGMLEQDANAV